MSAVHGLLTPFRQALYDGDLAALAKAVGECFAPKASVHLCHPFNTLSGPDEFVSTLADLTRALPDMERREHIVMAGTTAAGATWVGCCVAYVGTFRRPFLDIPPTGHAVAMRGHEFFRIEEGRVVEVQALWDLPELMLQAGVWPMAPALGREWQAPGPASQDGRRDRTGCSADEAADSHALVLSMLEGLGRHAAGGPEAMGLERYWHPHMSWYGPAGIGTARGIDGFRRWHQIPFLNALPDRVGDPHAGHLFADGPYVGFTAWPGMHMSVTGDGWLGIAPAGQRITMRSLDFWRCEAGLIRENWVLVDLLDVHAQLGVDVLGRMRELTAARYSA